MESRGPRGSLLPFLLRCTRRSGETQSYIGELMHGDARAHTHIHTHTCRDDNVAGRDAHMDVMCFDVLNAGCTRWAHRGSPTHIQNTVLRLLEGRDSITSGWASPAERAPL